MYSLDYIISIIYESKCTIMYKTLKNKHKKGYICLYGKYEFSLKFYFIV
jgi:hypothetical protein